MCRTLQGWCNTDWRSITCQLSGARNGCQSMWRFCGPKLNGPAVAPGKAGAGRLLQISAMTVGEALKPRNKPTRQQSPAPSLAWVPEARHDSPTLGF